MILSKTFFILQYQIFAQIQYLKIEPLESMRDMESNATHVNGIFQTMKQINSMHLLRMKMELQTISQKHPIIKLIE